MTYPIPQSYTHAEIGPGRGDAPGPAVGVLDPDVLEDLEQQPAHFVPLDPSVFNTHHFSAEVGTTADRVFAHRVA